jgi:hypothetical protein
MATLFNTKIKDTYQSLLKLEDNTILTTTTKNVTDGLGNASPLYMSTTRVGIGTNAPISTLNVLGLSTFVGASGNTLGSTTAGAAAAFYQTGFGGTLAIGGYSNSGGEIQGYQNNGSNVGGTMWLQRQAGNVLIGNTSDNAKLVVRGSGSTSATTSLLVQNSSATTALSILDDRSSNFNGTVNINTGITGGSYLLYVRSAFVGQELFTVQENQNMVLGCNNVVIRANATWNSQGQSGLAFNANNWYPQGDTRIGWSFTGNMFGATGGNSNLSLIRVNPSLGNFNSGTTSEVNCLLFNPAINQVNTGTYIVRGIYYNPTLTSLTSTTHTAIETVTGNVLLGTTSGNVGIGTSNPTNKLEVVGTSRISSTLNVGGDGSTSTSFASGFIAYDTGNAYGHSLVHAQSAQLYLFANPQGFAAGGYEPSSGGLSSGNLAFMTASTTRLKILNNGNVLIGTTTDSGYKLDVNGTARVTGAVKGGEGSNFNEIYFYGGGDRKIKPGVNQLDITDSAGVSGFQVGGGGGFPRVALGYDKFDFVKGLGNFTYSASGSNQVLTLNLNGQGANHLTPFADIVAQGYAFSAPSGNNTTLRLYTTNTTSGTYGNIIIGHNGTNATGNVGVGEASPTARLQVKGSGSTSATTSLLVQNSAGTAAMTVRDDLASVFGGQIIGVASGTFLINAGGTFTHTISGGASTLDYFNGFTIQNAGQGVIKSSYNGNTRFLRASIFGADSTNDASSQLQIDSTTKGFLPPRMTTAQKTAIVSPAEGLMVYDSTLKRPCFFDGTSWVTM